MLQYAVVEIAGRQYKVEPGKKLLVDNLGEVKEFECDKVLLLSDGKTVSLGAPYLKEKLQFEVVNNKRLPKVRVATYKAKANTRKVNGSRRMVTEILLKSETKEKTKSVKKSEE